MLKKLTNGLKAYKAWSHLWDFIESVRAYRREASMVDTNVVNGVPVKSPLRSKINWTGLGLFLSGAMSIIGKPLSPDEQAGIIESIAKAATWQDWVMVVTGALVIVLRTKFNNTVTAAPK